jgi:5-methylcytosine-specific restriction endonuclease McrA
MYEHVFVISTRQRVLSLRADGLSLTRIARELGLQKSTVAYHLRRAGEEPDQRFNRRYDWAEIQAYYDAGHSITQCQKKFGFSRETWNAARIRGAVQSRPQAMPMAQLVAGRRQRTHLKLRLLSAGLLLSHCYECGISEWRGRALSLPLHHINGDRHDNRLENLQLLCPNCHSQTENFAGRNKRRRDAA